MSGMSNIGKGRRRMPKHEKNRYHRHNEALERIADGEEPAREIAYEALHGRQARLLRSNDTKLMRADPALARKIHAAELWLGGAKFCEVAKTLKMSVSHAGFVCYEGALLIREDDNHPQAALAQLFSKWHFDVDDCLTPAKALKKARQELGGG
jgi:hypothetical protein